MIFEIYGENVNRAYAEAVRILPMLGKPQESRNGPVVTATEPVILTIGKPNERVLFDADRDCNPFFHVMEFVWMLAGSNDVKFIEYYNKRYREYADGDVVHGAYGHRWRNHFGFDQIATVIEHLRTDPKSRRAVIGMWSPEDDLTYTTNPNLIHKDIPCNTHIYFRTRWDDHGREFLDMTVCNRSNDMFWGMLGANIVHMTYLQELVARGCNMNVGAYRVFTNNLHAYIGMPGFEKIWGKTVLPYDPYQSGTASSQPLLVGYEDYFDLRYDAQNFVNGERYSPRTFWFKNVVCPMNCAWEERKSLQGDGLHYVNKITATDWRLACQEWIQRRMSLSATLMEPSQMTTTEQQNTSGEEPLENETGTGTIAR